MTFASFYYRNVIPTTRPFVNSKGLFPPTDWVIVIYVTCMLIQTIRCRSLQNVSQICLGLLLFNYRYFMISFCNLLGWMFGSLWILEEKFQLDHKSNLPSCRGTTWQCWKCIGNVLHHRQSPSRDHDEEQWRSLLVGQWCWRFLLEARCGIRQRSSFRTKKPERG